MRQADKTQVLPVGSGGQMGVTKPQGEQSTVSAEQRDKAQASRSGREDGHRWRGGAAQLQCLERPEKGGSRIRVNLGLGLCFDVFFIG